MNIETVKKILLLLFISIVIVSCSGKKEIQHDVYDPKAYLLKAEQLIEDEEYEEARKLLLEVKNRDYSQKYAPIAQLKIAESLARNDQFDEAIEEYRRFLRLYPDHTQAPYAQYQIALIYYKQIEGPDKGAGGARRALKEFQKLLRDYPRNPYREAAELRIKKCKNLIAEYELMVAKYYYDKGSYYAAIGRLSDLLREFPDYKRAPEVLYMTALAYKKLNKSDDAERYLQDIISRYPDSEYSKKAKETLASLKK